MITTIKTLIILTLLSTPLYLVRFNTFDIPTNLLDILIIATLALSLWHFKVWCKLKNLRISKALSPIVISLTLILAGAVIATIAAGNPASAWGIIKSWLLLPILFGYCLHLALANKILKVAQIGNTLIFGALIIAIIAIGYDLANITTYDHRLRAFYLSPNHLAMIIAPMLTLGIAQLIALCLPSKEAGATKHKTLSTIYTTHQFWLLLAICAIFAFVLWRTQSLGGIISVAISLSAVFILRKLYKLHNLRKTIKKPKNILTKVFVSIFATLLILTPILLMPKIADTLTNFDRSPLASRLMIWHSATDIIRDNFIIGIAPGQFQSHYLQYQQFYPPYLEWAVPEPHNLILAIWLSTGILGLIGFIYLIFIIISNLRVCQIGRRKIKPSQPICANHQTITLALLAALLTILTHGLIDTPIFKNDLALIFTTITTLYLFHVNTKNSHI